MYAEGLLRLNELNSQKKLRERLLLVRLQSIWL